MMISTFSCPAPAFGAFFSSVKTSSPVAHAVRLLNQISAKPPASPMASERFSKAASATNLLPLLAIVFATAALFFAWFSLRPKKTHRVESLQQTPPQDSQEVQREQDRQTYTPAELLYLGAQISLHEGDFSTAIKRADQGKRIAKDDTKLLQDLEAVRKTALEKKEQGSTETPKLSKEKTPPQLLHADAQKRLEEGKFEQVQQQIEESLRVWKTTDEERVRLYCDLATAYSKQGMVEKARETLQKALKLDPEDPELKKLLETHTAKAK